MNQITNRIRSAHTLFVLFSLGLLSGCSAPCLLPESMIPEDISSAQQVSDTVCIHIDNARTFLFEVAFAKAIDMSLLKAGLFNSIVSCEENRQYQLDVFVVHTASEPGLTRFSSSPATVVARWKLTNRDNGQILIDEEIVGTFVFHPSADYNRACRAMEGAARDNIRQGLARIAGL